VNKELYGNKYQIPSDVLSKLEPFKSEKTIANLLSKGEITYQNIKKIIHDMENGELDNLGGNEFREWLTQTLNSDKDRINNSNEIRTNSGMENQYISTHEKKNSIVRPSKKHEKTINKYDTAVLESLQRINDIMKKII
jgi:hypothetical protein